MQALSDERRIGRLEGKVDSLDRRMDRLEKKVDDGFAETRRELKGEITSARSDARSDFRTLIGVQLTTIVAMVLGFAALLLQHL